MDSITGLALAVAVLLILEAVLILPIYAALVLLRRLRNYRRGRR